MTHYGMLIDAGTCAGCNACTMACKYQNATPHGTYWCKVLSGERGTYPNAVQTVLPMSCQHCSNAPCVRVCPKHCLTMDPAYTPIATAKSCRVVHVPDPKAAVTES